MPRRHGWIKPLLDIACQYAAGDYPLIVLLNFENGVSRRYRDDELHQPPPATYFVPWTIPMVGYQFIDVNKKTASAVTGCKYGHRTFMDRLIIQSQKGKRKWQKRR